MSRQEDFKRMAHSHDTESSKYEQQFEKGGMVMIATTMEQSRRLLELGLDPKTADMTIGIDYQDKERLIADKIRNIQRDLEEIGYYDLYDIDYFHVLQPAWSLSALLEVMPRPDLYRETADLWVCVTFFKEGSIRGFGETAIEAACDTITKMFGRGYLKKKGGQDDNNH